MMLQSYAKREKKKRLHQEKLGQPFLMVYFFVRK